ncbi:class I SAM-dependent methyltransferase [Streptomyces sp. KM273126]|uniref:class I SAM-dependent methyltransferase n=1 Tax=Streptomyces sp. KM273126 TaxID=2545247 RepID=UPI0015EC2654|nr:class I SAM-dependent methyltransferase [Streptomyces sp. KM273126]MBA2808126.1 class I SAM-dependent methyltransferase [Streptomyces sp. KM273126]
MATPSRTTHAHSFNAAAAQYAANRPSYPPPLFDAIENIATRPLAGSRAIDVGAGTGIATTLLHQRGAHVLAVEPGDGMTTQFRRTHPHIPIIRGNGDALPLATASADFITYAQAWHWTDPARSLPEAMRVLRPGGALALWWNTSASDVPWIAAQSQRIDAYMGGDVTTVRGSGRRTRTEEVFAGAPHHPDCTLRELRWSRTVPIDTHLANIGSHSVFLVLGEEATHTFLTEERALLLDTFPNGMIEEVYDVVLIVVPRP